MTKIERHPQLVERQQAGGLVEEPSALGLLACYIVLAGGVLTIWSRYLRRSLRVEDTRSA